MTRPRLSLAAPLLASVLVAACGSSSATPSASTPSPAVTPQPSLSTLFAPPASDDAAPTPEVPSFDKGLEAKLPATFDGEALLRFSLSGTDAVRGDPTTLAVIAAAGKSVDDFSIAGAIGQTTGVSFMAIRLKGADESVIQQLFERSAEQSGDQVDQVVLGGRDVHRITGQSGTGAIYYVVEDDTALGLTAADDASAVLGLAALP